METNQVNQEKLSKLIQNLPQLEIAEKQLEKAIIQVKSIGEKWQVKNYKS
ncbi:hypothetical protein [Chroococcus sp. FPU101]|nr:hypothetical protein [Chroococcus sp. FPU101]GFE67868.1 hypothetical protein CFPU101_04780 [Chroococcus sp. FPU101]